MLGFDALAKLPLAGSVEDQAVAGVNAAADLTQASDTVAANAVVAVSGQAANTGAGDTIASTGALAVSAQASFTQADQTSSGSTSVEISGDQAAAQDANTISASAELLVSGDLAQTQASNALSATGALQVRASASISAVNDSLASTSVLLISGSAGISQTDNLISASAALPINGTADLTQENQVGAEGTVAIRANADIDQDDDTTTSAVTVSNEASLDVTQDDQTCSTPEPVQVYAPSFSSWAKAKDKKKPKAPVLPDPVQRGELVVDEAVLQQMELERLAALVLQKKQEALQKVEATREEGWQAGIRKETRSLARPELEEAQELPTGRVTLPLGERPPPEVTAAPARAVLQLGERRVTIEPATTGERRKLISLMAEQKDPPAREPITNRRVQRALGARNLAKPEMRLTKFISLRRDNAIRLNEYGT